MILLSNIFFGLHQIEKGCEDYLPNQEKYLLETSNTRKKGKKTSENFTILEIGIFPYEIMLFRSPAENYCRETLHFLMVSDFTNNN